MELISVTEIMYVVVDQSNSEDEYEEKLLGVTDSRGKAERFIANLQEQQLAVQARLDSIAEFDENYYQTYKAEKPKIKTLPRWPSGLGEEDVSDAMREERKVIRKYNKSIGDRTNKELLLWEANRDKARKEFIKHSGLENISNEVYVGNYSIREVKVIQ